MIHTYIEYCYAKKGEDIKGCVNGKKYRRVGIVAAQQSNKVLAPLQYDGTMNSILFETWFETRLMCEFLSASIIIMDNAAFHQKKQLISIAEKQGHRVLFLPPYSPELNTIENLWTIIKSRLRKFLPSFSLFDDPLHYCFMLN